MEKLGNHFIFDRIVEAQKIADATGLFLDGRVYVAQSTLNSLNRMAKVKVVPGRTGHFAVLGKSFTFFPCAHLRPGAVQVGFAMTSRLTFSK